MLPLLKRLQLTVVAVLCVGASATTAKLAIEQFDSEVPELEVIVPNDGDLGTIPQGEAVSIDFILRNRCRNRISIVDVIPTCSCTVPQQLSGTVIEPGTATTASLEYQSGSARGGQSADVLLRYRIEKTAEQKNALLKIKALVEPDYDVSSFRLAFSSDSASMQTVAISPRRLDNVQIMSARSSRSWFTPAILTNTKVEVKLIAEKYDPTGGDAVLIVNTNSRRCPVCYVDLKVSPSPAKK
jgi:hypothetical protein